MFYAAVNSYATETSIGFANTWGVIGFHSAKARDAYVTDASDLATKAISATELAAYGAKRGQVSHYTVAGDFMEHCGRGEFVRMPSASDAAVDLPASIWG